MGAASLTHEQKLSVQVLLEKENKTPEDEKAIKILKEKNLISIDQENQGVLEKFFSDKPGTELAIRTGAGAGGELVAGKKAMDFLGKLPGPVGKISKFGRSIAIPAVESLGALLGDLVGQQATGQETDLGEAGTSAGFSLGGNALFRGGRGIANLFRKKRISPKDFESPAAERGFQRIATEKTVTTPVASIIKSKSTEIFTSVAKQAPMSAGVMRRAGESVKDFYNGLITKFSAKYIRTASPEGVGNQIREILRDKVAFTTGARHKIIDELDEFVGGIPINLKKIGEDSVSYRTAIEMLDTATPKATEEIISQMKTANYKAVEGFKREAKELIKDANATLTGAAKTKTLKAIQKRLNVSVESLDSIVDSAVMFTNKNSTILELKMIEALAEKSPHTLVSELVKHPALLKNAMALLKGKKGLVNNVRSVFLGGVDEGGGLLGASSKTIKGNRVLDPNMLVDNIKKFRSLHKDAEFILFPKVGLKGLQELAEEMAALTAECGSKAGTMAIFLQTPAAVATIASIPFGVPAAVAIGGAGSILFGPRAIAEVLTDPTWAKRMIEGVNKFGKDDLKLTNFFIKFTSQLIAEGFNVSWEPLERKGIRFKGAGGL